MANVIGAWWTKAEENRYVTEASDFGTDNLTCPICNVAMLKGKGKPHYDGEGELTHWTYRHCETELVVFND